MLNLQNHGIDYEAAMLDTLYRKDTSQTRWVEIANQPGCLRSWLCLRHGREIGTVYEEDGGSKVVHGVWGFRRTVKLPNYYIAASVDTNESPQFDTLAEAKDWVEAPLEGMPF